MEILVHQSEDGHQEGLQDLQEDSPGLQIEGQDLALQESASLHQKDISLLSPDPADLDLPRLQMVHIQLMP